MNSFPNEAVEAQLERILASPVFVGRDKLCRFLRYVVEQKQANHPDQIKQYAIAVEGLGFSKDFDPSANPSVRILAQRLRRALEQYYMGPGASDPVRIRIPKGRYAPVFVVNRSKTETTGASDNAVAPTATAPNEFAQPTIAVWEFEILDDQANDSFRATGLSVEILVALTRFADLTVLGPFARVKDQRDDFCKVNHEYGAAFALQGWIRSQGSRIRITTELTETSSGDSLWAETFEYDLDKTSLFQIEDEVTSNIAGVIADGLGLIFRKLQTESYQEHIKLNDVTTAILTYNNAWATHAPQDFKRANKAISQALAVHPNNALLLALQSNLYYGDLLHGLDLSPDALSKMVELAVKAISLDPNLQIAQYNLVVQHAFFGRVEQCIEAAQRVVKMNPNHARILAGCAMAVTSVGAYELGIELIERAKRLNPHYPSWYFLINYLVDFHKEQYEKAWADAQLIHVEGLVWHPIFRAAVLGKLGRVEEAQPFIDEIRQINSDFLQRPCEYIRRLFPTDDHTDMIWDGLQKAGIGNQVSLVK